MEPSMTLGNVGIGTKLGLFLLRVLTGLEFILAAWSKIWPGFDFGKFANGWLKQKELAAYLEGHLNTIRPELGFYQDVVRDVFLKYDGVFTYVVVFGELLIGVALVLGLLTRTAAMCGVVMMAGYFMLTWDRGPIGYDMLNNAALFTFALCAFIAVSGAGLVGGLDAKIRKP